MVQIGLCHGNRRKFLLYLCRGLGYLRLGCPHGSLIRLISGPAGIELLRRHNTVFGQCGIAIKIQLGLR